MSAGKSDRRLKVVKRMVRPNAEVMESRSQSNFFQLYLAARRKGHAEVHDAVRMISVRSKIVAQFRRMAIQHLINNRDLFEQIHVLRPLVERTRNQSYVNRLTNS